MNDEKRESTPKNERHILRTVLVGVIFYIVISAWNFLYVNADWVMPGMLVQLLLFFIFPVFFGIYGYRKTKIVVFPPIICLIGNLIYFIMSMIAFQSNTNVSYFVSITLILSVVCLVFSLITWGITKIRSRNAERSNE